MSLVRRNPARVPAEIVAGFAPYGVATVHEAQGRKGQLAAYMRPAWPRARAIGTAVTVSLPPADNWIIHVAVEQCREGDLLVVAPTSPSDAGYFGELLACSLRARGVAGLVIEGGCRGARGDGLPGVEPRHLGAGHGEGDARLGEPAARLRRAARGAGRPRDGG